MTSTLSEKTPRMFDEQWFSDHLEVLALQLERFKPENLKRDSRTNRHSVDEGASSLYIRIQQLQNEKESVEKDLGRMKQKLSEVSDEYVTKKNTTLFQRLRENMNLEGSGTGLSICKQIMENHGGLIYADGLKNVGATFTMFFPVTQKIGL